MTKLFGVSCHHPCHHQCLHLCHHLCCQLLCRPKKFRVRLIIMYDRTMRTVQQSIALFATLILLLLLIVIYDCAGTYNETIIMIGMLDNDDGGLSCQPPC